MINFLQNYVFIDFLHTYVLRILVKKMFDIKLQNIKIRIVTYVSEQKTKLNNNFIIIGRKVYTSKIKVKEI